MVYFTVVCYGMVRYGMMQAFGTPFRLVRFPHANYSCQTTVSGVVVYSYDSVVFAHVCTCLDFGLV